ncbi:MAG: hypothetical protein L0Y39_01910 [Methylococcaceae bacterium]|nr:hypothetical protein [Methylococcaceae bacterium]
MGDCADCLRGGVSTGLAKVMPGDTRDKTTFKKETGRAYFPVDTHLPEKDQDQISIGTRLFGIWEIDE